METAAAATNITVMGYQEIGVGCREGDGGLNKGQWSGWCGYEVKYSGGELA